MSRNVAGKQEYKPASVTKEESIESSESYITPTKKYLKLCKESYIFYRDPHLFNKRQIQILEDRSNSLFNILTKARYTLFDDVITLAQIYYNICAPYSLKASKEKRIPSNVTEMILRSKSLLKDIELDRGCIMLVLSIYNALGHIYFAQKRIKEAIEICDKAVKLYFTYIEKKDEYGIPIDLQDIVYQLPAIDNYTKLMDLYILLLQNLIKLHEFLGPSNKEKAIAYTHMLLTAEFCNLKRTKEYAKWIKSAVSVSDYLLVNNRFPEAKSHLVVATFVKKCLENDDSVKKETCMEQGTIPWTIVIHWIKYAVSLLRRSAEYPLRLKERENLVTDDSKRNFAADSQEHTMQTVLIFAKIEEEHSISSHSHFTLTEHITNYYDARTMFYFVLKYINHAKTFSRSKKLCTINVLLVCSAFKYMACYETTLTRRMLLHGRRIELLFDTFSLISKTAKNFKILRYLLLQLAIDHAAMIDVNFDKLKDIHPTYKPEKRNLIYVEINRLVKMASTYLETNPMNLIDDNNK